MCHFCNLLGNLLLRYWQGIFSSESFDKTFNGKNLFSICLVNGNLSPNQMEGLGDGCERIRDRLKMELISLTVRHGAHPGGEIYEYYCLFTGIDWVKVWTCSAFLAIIVPVKSILLPSPGSLHSDLIINWSSHKHEVPRNATFEGILYYFHDWFWGRDKRDLK